MATSMSMVPITTIRAMATRSMAATPFAASANQQSGDSVVDDQSASDSGSGFRAATAHRSAAAEYLEQVAADDCRFFFIHYPAPLLPKCRGRNFTAPAATTDHCGNRPGSW